MNVVNNRRSHFTIQKLLQDDKGSANALAELERPQLETFSFDYMALSFQHFYRKTVRLLMSVSVARVRH